MTNPNTLSPSRQKLLKKLLTESDHPFAQELSVTTPHAESQKKALRELLAQQLPDYMQPSDIIFLDKSSLCQWQIDHKALPRAVFGQNKHQQRNITPPRTLMKLPCLSYGRRS
ncbi:MAG: hypothetical protein R2880_06745 [Deinococcales bacterium]